MKKMIYLEDAIDAVKAMEDKSGKGEIAGFYNAILKRVIDKLNELPSAEPEQECEKCIFRPFKQFQPEQRWIPCDRMLPEKHERAITLYDNGKISSGEYIGDRTWNVDYGDSDKKVKIVAWLPMPIAESYAEGRADEETDISGRRN